MGQALKKRTHEERDYINLIHNSSIGWITKASIKEKSYHQWHYKIKDLLELDLTGENNYISVNTFYTTFRRLEYLKEIKACFIDLDTYNTKFTKEQILMNLQENYFNKSIPIPNLIIDSGRGVYLIWLINKVPSVALPLWNAVQDYLYKQLKKFGADRKALDATRVLRVPGSTNSKSNTVVKTLEQYDYIYDLKEIQNNFLPELKPYKKKKGRPQKVNFIYRERSLYFARIQDLAKLCELREYDLKGHRELLLFLYRYYLCSFKEDVEDALNDVLELNSQFINPLTENEVKRATKSAETCYLSKDKQYKYKNTTLIELLHITEQEQQHLITIISKEEYKRRENIRGKKNYKNKLIANDKLTEKEKIAERRGKIKDLLQQGLKQLDICTKLNISKTTYVRDRKYLKEQGLI